MEQQIHQPETTAPGPTDEGKLAVGDASTTHVGTRPMRAIPCHHEGGPKSADRAGGLRLTGVTRIFGAHPAVILVDLAVARGEVVLLTGHNGAGKTTLLRIAATAIAPTYGGGTVLGFDLVREKTAIRGRTEMLGARTRLYEDLTPLEYLRFVAQLTLPQPRIALEDLLERVDLVPARDMRIRELSQGMRQRLALARAHMRRPELLLVDEPYSALDQAGREELDKLIEDTRFAGGCVLLATHDVERARRVADRVVDMRGGRIDSDVPVYEAARR